MGCGRAYNGRLASVSPVGEVSVPLMRAYPQFICIHTLISIKVNGYHKAYNTTENKEPCKVKMPVICLRGKVRCLTHIMSRIVIGPRAIFFSDTDYLAECN